MQATSETEHFERRISRLEDRMDRILARDEKSGIIFEMKKDLSALKDLAFKARYVFMGCAVSIVIMQMLSGSGTVSLQSILKALGK